MPLVPFLAALLLVFLLVLSTPFLLVVRYRMGMARRPARRWIATTNAVSLFVSAGFFLWIAALTNFWVPRAFTFSKVCADAPRGPIAVADNANADKMQAIRSF